MSVWTAKIFLPSILSLQLNVRGRQQKHAVPVLVPHQESTFPFHLRHAVATAVAVVQLYLLLLLLLLQLLLLFLPLQDVGQQTNITENINMYFEVTLFRCNSVQRKLKFDTVLISPFVQFVVQRISQNYYKLYFSSWGMHKFSVVCIYSQLILSVFGYFIIWWFSNSVICTIETFVHYQISFVTQIYKFHTLLFQFSLSNAVQLIKKY